LENIERSSSFEVDSKPDLSNHRKTENVELLESDSPLFMKERHNSFEESPDVYKEGTDHFQNIGPVFSKRKPKFSQSPQSSLNSNNFAAQFRDVGAMDTFLFEQNRILQEDM
jgi:hypothetical protein